MRLSIRDGLATVWVAAAGTVYLLWATGSAMTAWSARTVAVLVFALGWAACVTDQKQMAMVYGAAHEEPRPPAAYVVIVSAIGVLALVTGVIALVTGSTAMLATMAASMGGLWLLATARHAVAPGNKGAPRLQAKTG